MLTRSTGLILATMRRAYVCIDLLLLETSQKPSNLFAIWIITHRTQQPSHNLAVFEWAVGPKISGC